MTFRSRNFIVLACVVSAGCAHPAPEVARPPIPVEALTDAASIQLRCEHPDDVIAGRAFCVLKDLPTRVGTAP